MPTTSNDLLGTLIPEWQSLLQRWALDGSLAAAAQEALLPNGTPPARPRPFSWCKSRGPIALI